MMWARVVELILGCWVATTPLVFAGERTASAWASDLACGVAVAGLALASFWRSLRRAHPLTLAVAAWLVGVGYAAGSPAPPAAQSRLAVGLLLLMFAIVPSRASDPPEGWRREGGREETP